MYEYALQAVQIDGRALEFLTDNFKKDRTLVTAAVSKYGDALRHAAVELREDRDVVMAAVKNMGEALAHAPAFQGDREIVFAAVASDGSALQHATSALKADKEVVIAAVKRHSHALQFASEELRGDVEVVLEASKQSSMALYKEFGLLAFTPMVHPLHYASDEIKANRHVILQIVELNGLALQYAHESFRSDLEMVYTAVRSEGTALQFISEDLLRNRDVVFAAVKSNGQALDFAPRFRRDPLINRIACRTPMFYTREGLVINIPGLIDEYVMVAPPSANATGLRRGAIVMPHVSLHGSEVGPPSIGTKLPGEIEGVGESEVWTVPEARQRVAEVLVSCEVLGVGDERTPEEVAKMMRLKIDDEFLPVGDSRKLKALVEASLRKGGLGEVTVVVPTKAELEAEAAAKGPPNSKELKVMCKDVREAMLVFQRTGREAESIEAYRKMLKMEKRLADTIAEEKAAEATREAEMAKARIEEEAEMRRQATLEAQQAVEAIKAAKMARRNS